jgi:far upstream element-binding protein
MDGKNYSAVPPPPSLTASSKDAAPLNFNDALSKARAIAEKLKQQSSGGGSAISEQPVAAIATSGTIYILLRS